MEEPDEIPSGTILHAELDAFYASVEQKLFSRLPNNDATLKLTPKGQLPPARDLAER